MTGALLIVAGAVVGSAGPASISRGAERATPGPVRADLTATLAATTSMSSVVVMATPAPAVAAASSTTKKRLTKAQRGRVAARRAAQRRADPRRTVAPARHRGAAEAAAAKTAATAAEAAAVRAGKARAKSLLANPAASVVPTAAFGVACYGQKAASTCNPVAVAAINSARAGEHLPAVVLPANFETRSISSQLVWIANAERTVRGLPVMAQNATLNAEAAAGAEAGVDPQGPNGYDWRSNLAWGYATPLAADFAWMYDDGPGGTNVACSATVKTGCWGHRTNILLAGRGSSGAGSFLNHGRPQLAEVFAPKFT